MPKFVDGMYALVRVLLEDGYGEFDFVLQTEGRRDETIVALATESAASIWPKKRSEVRRLTHGGYVNYDGMFVRSKVKHVFQEAVAVAKLCFPKRAPEARKVQVDETFQTPVIDLERLPGVWKRLALTSFRKEAPTQLITILVRRTRGRWRKPANIRVLHTEELQNIQSSCIPISANWEVDLDALRAVTKRKSVK